MFRAFETGVLELCRSPLDWFVFRGRKRSGVSQPMLCLGRLGEYFDLGRATTVSFRISPRPSTHAQAFRLTCDGLHVAGVPMAEYLLGSAKAYLHRKGVKLGETIYVTVYTHDD